MKSPTPGPNENQRVQKSRKDETASAADLGSAGGEVSSQALPASRGRGVGVPSRSAVMRLQRQVGNAFVQRQLSGKRGVSRAAAGIQREGEDEPVPAGATGTTSIGDGSASVTAAGGQVKADGAAVELNGPLIALNSAVVQASGVLRAGTIIADTVVAANYTPGAGNVM